MSVSAFGSHFRGDYEKRDWFWILISSESNWAINKSYNILQSLYIQECQLQQKDQEMQILKQETVAKVEGQRSGDLRDQVRSLNQ